MPDTRIRWSAKIGIEVWKVNGIRVDWSIYVHVRPCSRNALNDAQVKFFRNPAG